MSARRALAAALAIALPLSAAAEETFSFDDGKLLVIGAGLRTSLDDTQSHPVPVGQLDDAVLALDAQLNDALKLQLNAIATSPTQIIVLDAIAELEPASGLRLWAGLLLPAQDRLGMEGPFFATLWEPALVSAFPGSPSGRSPGGELWGRVANDHLRYQLGAFTGLASAPGPMWVGRLQLDLLDPEPGYYTSSTWLGDRNTLAIGLGGRSQPRGAGGPHAFEAGSADVFFEHRLGGWGTPSVTAEALDYDLGGARSPALFTGLAEDVEAAYLFPWSPADIQLQPSARWEQGTQSVGGALTKVTAGVNLWWMKRTARLTLEGYQEHGAASTTGARLGLQLLL